MKLTQTYTVRMTREEVVDLLMTGVYVRRVGVRPPDSNLYITVKHIADRQSTVIRNVWTGKDLICLWSEIEFA
jgi:hypothetical protein